MPDSTIVVSIVPIICLLGAAIYIAHDIIQGRHKVTSALAVNNKTYGIKTSILLENIGLKLGLKCTENTSFFRCHCAPNYSSLTCELYVKCAEYPCFHLGSCYKQAANDSAYCVCSNGTTGAKCETNINDCRPGLCQNGGTCVDLISQYVCKCRLGYTGFNCELNIDDCASNPCQNGLCKDGYRSYTCHCDKQYYGPNCNYKKLCLEELRTLFPIGSYKHHYPEKIIAFSVYQNRLYTINAKYKVTIRYYNINIPYHLDLKAMKEIGEYKKDTRYYLKYSPFYNSLFMAFNTHVDKLSSHLNYVNRNMSKILRKDTTIPVSSITLGLAVFRNVIAVTFSNDVVLFYNGTTVSKYQPIKIYTSAVAQITFCWGENPSVILNTKRKYSRYSAAGSFDKQLQLSVKLARFSRDTTLYKAVMCQSKIY